jgi:hypothetical protein
MLLSLKAQGKPNKRSTTSKTFGNLAQQQTAGESITRIDRSSVRKVGGRKN